MPRTVTGKQCVGCESSKPITDFPRTPSGQRGRYCSSCKSSTARQVTIKRTANRRARQRATSLLLTEYAFRFEQLFQQELPKVLREMEELGGHQVKLLPGPAKEGQKSITERIAKLCPDCSSHHRHNHACQSCGSVPTAPVRIVNVANGEKLRLQPGDTVVVKA
jgi:hypothetical protein